MPQRHTALLPLLHWCSQSLLPQQEVDSRHPHWQEPFALPLQQLSGKGRKSCDFTTEKMARGWVHPHNDTALVYGTSHGKWQGAEYTPTTTQRLCTAQVMANGKGLSTHPQWHTEIALVYGTSHVTGLSTHPQSHTDLALVRVCLHVHVCVRSAAVSLQDLIYLSHNLRLTFLVNAYCWPIITSMAPAMLALFVLFLLSACDLVNWTIKKTMSIHNE